MTTEPFIQKMLIHVTVYIVPETYEPSGGSYAPDCMYMYMHETSTYGAKSATLVQCSSALDGPVTSTIDLSHQGA